MTLRNRTARACAAALATAGLAAAAPATAQNSGDWLRTGRSTIPLEYYQGVTSDDRGNVFFSGFSGIFKTGTSLRERGRNADVIDPAAKRDPGFNHIGDISWDDTGGGRVILPLECYDPRRNPSNTCGVGGFGVVDSDTLQWRYWVKLDPADIPKAMWAEVAPDGRSIWTSSGDDLLAYDTADLTRANAQPAGPPIRPVRRIAGAVPDHGITGAVFARSKLLLAGQARERFQVTSVDLTTGIQRAEIAETINGESEGLDTFSGRGGRLHWMVMPLSSTGPPSFERDKGSLLHYNPRPTRLRIRVTPRRARAGRRTRFTFRVTDDNGDPVRRAKITFARARARTNSRGRARITRTLTKPGRYTAKATRNGLKRARTVVRSSR